ncbi:uncharacterized protein PSFLO_05733 [Pseudozyma flocculosa]|uniref:Uncharacterized protein n=1 Tax=Pseudozyma flocculosa TaxID=84751 RepID=A0A5C3FA31_9BASI|nr:uncharacterized protein PSFLO_05733 [Pseudozyma flocculosa]
MTFKVYQSRTTPVGRGGTSSFKLRLRRLDLHLSGELHDGEQDESFHDLAITLLIVSEEERRRDGRRYLHFDEQNRRGPVGKCEELWTEPFHHETEAWVEYPVGASFFNHASACVRVTLAEIDGRLSSGPDNTLVLDLGFSGAATKRLRLEVRGVVWERSLGCDPPEPYWRCREMAELSCCLDTNYIDSMIWKDKDRALDLVFSQPGGSILASLCDKLRSGIAEFSRADLEAFRTLLRRPLPSFAQSGSSKTTILANAFSSIPPDPQDVRIHHHRLSLIRSETSQYGTLEGEFIAAQQAAFNSSRTLAIKTFYPPSSSPINSMASSPEMLDKDPSLAWSGVVTVKEGIS